MVSLRMLAISVRSGHLGMDWDGFYSPDALWEALVGSTSEETMDRIG